MKLLRAAWVRNEKFSPAHHAEVCGRNRLGLVEGLLNHGGQVELQRVVDLEDGELLPEAVLHVRKNVFDPIEHAVVRQIEEQRNVQLRRPISHQPGFVARGVVEEDGELLVRRCCDGDRVDEANDVLLLLELLA